MSRIDEYNLRPSPEALLAVAGRANRGRLKVFLGSAPGVGKTYAMLQAGQARKREGIDVVVGVAETHGREETKALLVGLEIIPRLQIEYRGTHLTEMDIDAILARHPQLVIVDELAHSNAPNSRHPKRYQDVDELLAAGIDVYTTVNVQHLESLNDAVSRITGIQVRETLPDRLLEQADEVQLIDLPPEELIERLHQGKVYVPDQATRAIQNYFKPGNLNALRELALRRAAERVDVQMQDYMKAQAIPGPWPTTDRLMVCVSPSPSSMQLVRAAKRRADRRNAPWLAVYVETPAHQRMSESDQMQVAKTLRLAEQLGAETVSIPGHRPADDLIQYARTRNVTEIIIGKSSRSWWQEFRYGSIVGDLIRKSGAIDVYVIKGEEAEQTPEPVKVPVISFVFRWQDYLLSGFIVLIASLIAKLLVHYLALPNLSMIFLLGVLFVAVQSGLWPSLFASVLTALIYNFFFIEPRHTFTIASPQETLAFFVYIIVAIITSHITARMREQSEAAHRRENRTSAMLALSRAIIAAPGVEAAAQAVVGQVTQILRAPVSVLLPSAGELKLMAIDPPGTTLSQHDIAAASWAWTHNRPTGIGTDTLPGVLWTFIPLGTAHGTVGVLGIRADNPSTVISPGRFRLMEGLADQIVLGIERARLREEMEQAKVLTETEKLRSALLSSVSHDLRTPLASIIGSASSLLSFGDSYDQMVRTDLLKTIQEEAERLNRFVGNLLDITRLESGKLELKREWVEIQDVIGTATQRLSTQLSSYHVVVDTEPNLPLMRLDFVLTEQVLINLLENAAKYSQPGSTITIEAQRRSTCFTLKVIDEGIGVAPDELERIFDKFYRIRGGDRQVAGTGLGLSICRGIVEAHGGNISASLPPAGKKGLIITVSLPIEEQPPEIREPEHDNVGS